MEAKLPGLAPYMEPSNPGMHTTDTIDFEYIVTGEVWLDLDDGAAVHLRAGDTVVQNGTRHRWRNEGAEPVPHRRVHRRHASGRHRASTSPEHRCSPVGACYDRELMDHLNFYIDGAWVPPAKPATRDVINPSTEQPIGRISMGSAEDVDRAVKAARKAFATYSRTTREERIALLENILKVYKTRHEELAKTISDRSGRADLAVESRAGRDRHRRTSRRRSRC